MALDWGGGGGSETSDSIQAPKPHVHHGFLGGLHDFFGNAWHKAGEYLGALPQMPSQFAHEVNRAVGFVAPTAPTKRLAETAVPGSRLTFAWRGWTHLPFRHSTAPTTDTGPKSFPDLLHQIHTHGVWRPILDLPLVRFVPGTKLARDLATDEHGHTGGSVLGHLSHAAKAFEEDPIGSALDIYPFLHEGTRLATKGSSIAEEAARHAEDLGHAGAAAKIRRYGLTPPKLAKQVYRRGEARAEHALVDGHIPFVPAMPWTHGLMPSQILARSGLGGETARFYMRVLGEAQAHHALHVNIEQARLAGIDAELGIKEADAEKITHAGTYPSDPDWRAKTAEVNANGPEYIRRIDAENNALVEHSDGELGFRDVNGLREVFPKSELKRFTTAENLIRRMQKEHDALLDPVGFRGEKAAAVVTARDSRRAATLTKRIERTIRAMNTIVPARYKPMIEEAVKDDVLKRYAPLEAHMGPVEWGHFTDQIRAGDYRVAGIPELEIRAFRAQRAAKWQDLQKFDPLYYHHVAAEEVKSVFHPKLITRIVKPGNWKRLAWDMRPWVENASVGLKASWADHIRFRESERLSQIMRDTRGVMSQAEMEAETARWASEGAGKGPQGSDGLRARTNDLRSRYQVYDPRLLMPREGGVAAGAKGDFYIPKELARALENARGPVDGGIHSLGRVMEGGANVFRMSYLFTKPFYYVHVVVSGLVIDLARGGPGDLLKLPKSLGDMLHSMRTAEYPTELGLGYGRMAGPQDARFQAFSSMADHVARRYGNESLGDMRAVTRRVQRFTRTAAAVTQDMWKAASYLGEKDRMVRRGFTQEEAVSLAVEHANKAFGSMHELMPWERVVMRQVLPFYSWSKHLLQYVSSYPFDHPWRASVVSHVGAAVLEDWQRQHADLPPSFMHYLWLWHDKKGDQVMFPASGLIPFTQVGDMVSWTGFFTRMDPRAKAWLESRGLDPYTGGPQASWKLQPAWDAAHDQEVFKTPNVFSKLVQTMIPQVDPFLNSDIQSYYASHPDKRREAIIRALLGASTRNVNLAQEAAKAMKRYAYEQRDYASWKRSQEKQKAPTGASGGLSW